MPLAPGIDPKDDFARAGTLLASPAAASAAFNITVEEINTVPTITDACNATVDDVCDDWGDADWLDRDSEYYFYLYDEVADGQNLKFWQWPRITPTSKFFSNNGFCEDGHPSTTGKPTGEYYLRFAHRCETDEVQVMTGTYGGCGQLVYVPCGIGAPPPPN